MCGNLYWGIFFFFDTGSARTAVELAMISGLMQYIKIVKTIMELFDNNEPRLNFFRFSGVFIFNFCKSRKNKKRKKLRLIEGWTGLSSGPEFPLGMTDMCDPSMYLIRSAALLILGFGNLDSGMSNSEWRMTAKPLSTASETKSEFALWGIDAL